MSGKLPIYREVWGIAVGDIVRTEFGPTPECNRYHTGPYRVKSILGPILPSAVWRWWDDRPEAHPEGEKPAIYLTVRLLEDDGRDHYLNDIRLVAGQYVRGGGKVFVEKDATGAGGQMSIFDAVAGAGVAS